MDVRRTFWRGLGWIPAAFSFLFFLILAQPVWAQWIGKDLGSVGVPGTDSYNTTTGVYTIQGSGTDIGGTVDAGHFVYQTLTADGELEARVASLQNTSGTAKAGVMIRQSTSAGDINAFLAITPTSGAFFQQRTSLNANTASTQTSTSTAPYWLRIVKDGTIVTVFQSPDGINWTYAGLTNLTNLTSPVEIGFAVTSNNNTALCTATFDNIAISAQTSYAPTSPWFDQDVGTTGQTGLVHLESGGWSVYGAGSGIAGAADSFHYACQAMSGNGIVIARVDGVSPSATSSGVVMRQDLTAGSAEASVLLNAASGISFATRTTAGASLTSTTGASVSAPYWVKLVRAGNVFYGYQSTDGSTWTLVGNQTINMTGTIYVGVATTSGGTGTMGIGFLDRVAVIPNGNYLVTGDIAAGDNHNLYLQPNGSVWVWGLNNSGQVGDGTTTTRKSPVPLTTLSNMEAVSAGTAYSLALGNNGTVWAWGLNTHGQLGDGTTTQQTSPEQLTTLSGIVAISAGGSQSLALDNNGHVWAWGLNANGQLGDGTTTQKTSPEQLTTLSGIVAISAGTSHSLALKSDGTVWAWGLNSNGQLGTGTTTKSTIPVQLTSLSNIVAISAGASHSLALDEDGNVWAWGDNDDGDVGDGTITQRNSPVEITSLSGITAIKASNLFSLALKNDGTVWAWGKNSSGQLGNNTTTEENSPVQALGLTGAVAISAGSVHSAAITSNGAIWTWGGNTNGQLGIGTTTGSLVPVVLTPSINSAATATGTVGASFTYAITATTIPTSFTASGLPPGLTLNTSTGVISGTPSTVGIYGVPLSASNISGTGTATLTIIINPPAPVITSATTATGTMGATFSYQIAASNSPTSFGATGLPAGLSVNPTSGVISGTPLATGTSSVTVSASNAGGMGSKTLTLTVTPPAPVITSPTTATATKGVAFGYQITASNNPTSFSATGLPSGLSVNTTTGAISGTPTGTSISTVILKATNAGGAGTATLILTVNPLAPVITSALNATGTTGKAFSYAITASNSPTSYSASGLPAGLSLTTTTGKITGTPTTVGTYSVTIGATNAGGAATATLALTINPPAPVISSSTTATGTIGAAFTYQITASNSPTSYGATGLPSGLSLNSSTGLISGTPLATGTSSVTVSASNAGGMGNKTLTLTVNPPIPVITSPITATAAKGVAFSYQIVATNNPTSFSVTGTLPAGLSFNTGTGVLAGTPTATTTKTYSLTLNASNAGGKGSATLTLTINPLAPVINSPLTATGSNGSAFTYQIAATNLPGSFNASGLPAGLTVNTSTGVISGTPTSTGTFAVTVSATNATGTGTASLILTINIAAPVISSTPTATGLIGVAFTYTITATNNPTSFGATGLPNGLSINPTTGIISGTPTAAGTSMVTLSAGNAGGTGTATLTLNIVTTMLSITGGNTQSSTPGAFASQPLSVTITYSGGGNAPSNIPVTFTVTSGGGLVAATSGGTTSTSLVINTDSNGNAQVYFQQPSGLGVTSQISATAQGQSANFTETSYRPALVGWWKFDDGTGSTAADSSGLNNNATLVGAPSWVSGVYGDALQLNGSSQYAQVSEAPSLDLGSNSLTLSGWFKTGAISAFMPIFSKELVNANGYHGFHLGLNAIGNLEAEIGDTTGSSPLIFSTQNSFADNQWHQVILLVDQVGQTAQIEVDGTLQSLLLKTGSVGTLSGTLVSFTGITNLNATTSQPLSLGSNPAASEYFSGTLDDLRIDNYLLTISQRSSLIDSAGSGLPDWWQMKYFGQIGNNPNSSPDGNGYTLLQDYQGGADPTNYYSQPGSNGPVLVAPTLTVSSGNNQTVSTNNFAGNPLVVQVSTPSGIAANAPVTFSLASGTTGALSTTNSGSGSATVTTTTNNQGQTSVYFLAPSAGESATILATGGTSPNTSQVSFSIAVTSNQVAAGGLIAGGDASYLVKNDTSLKAWGNNTLSQLGLPAPTSVNTPTAVGSGYLSVSSRGNHTLFLHSDNSVWAVGNNYFGQLGTGNHTNLATPQQISGLANIIAVAAGASHSLALTQSGTVVAWGGNYAGQLGLGTTTDSLTPTAVAGLTGVTAIAAGRAHSLALSGGNVYAWGDNSYGQLGNGTRTNSIAPVQVAGLTNIIAITAGDYFSVAIAQGGTVYVWGANSSGQLALGHNNVVSTPQAIGSVSNATGVVAGAEHLVVLGNNGSISASGANSSGQLGTANNTASNVLQSVWPNGIIQIAAGFDHTLALKPDGSLLVFGANNAGQLGNGSTQNAISPTPVAAP